MRLAHSFALTLAAGLLLGGSALAAPFDTEARAPRSDVSWSFEGPFGTYDRAALQRGFQVYKEVCSACHRLSHIAFHNLSEPGGPGFTVAQAKAIAAGYQIPAAPNDKGEIFDDKGNRLTRPGILADTFPRPFPNEEAARAANGGAWPPDLSEVVKARKDGSHYVYSILTGFHEKPPAGFKVLAGKYYNPYFAGWNISMPPPLADDSVTFSDGTKATVAQEAHDVVTFLTWASYPHMEARKRLGMAVLLFLILLSGLLFFSYRKIWKDAH
jgi:ubiquinol-cytochrome c reductase cytochrome b/c1 subunit